jgi:chemotaxis protein methyltransferase CheR
MTVSISRFFRDRELWRIMEEHILPELAERKSTTIKIWSAGCACGEEVYTVNMAIYRSLPTVHRAGAFCITATDMNPVYIEKAKKGNYGRSSLREMSERLLSNGFDERRSGKRYIVKPAFKRNVTWKVHRLTDETPGSGFDIILLRNNLLTYYSDKVQIPAFSRILGSLAPPGFLVIGSHETLPGIHECLKPVQGSKYIFQRQETV